MMNAIAYVMVMVGCADDETQCRPIAQPSQVYASRDACLADQDAALNSDIAARADHPIVVVNCVARPTQAIREQRSGRTRVLSRR